MFKLIISDLKDCITGIKESFVNNIKYFFVTYVLSVLFYQFFINNLLMNTEDTMGTSTFYMGGAWNVSLGRFFYAVWQVLFMGINAEPVNTMFALFLLCLSIFLVFNIFNENKLLYLFSTLMMISCSIVYYGLSHRYSSVAGQFSILFSVLSIYGIVKFKNFATKLIFSTLCLVVSLGLGQYAIGITALIFLFYGIYSYVLEDAKLEDIFKLIYQYAIVFVLGLLLYKLSWDIVMKICKVSVPSYVGASDIGFVNIIVMLPSALIKSYGIVLEHFNGNIIKYNIFGTYIINYFLIIFAIIILSIFTYKKFKSILITLIIDLASIIFVPPILAITIFFTPSYQHIRPHQMFTFALFIPMLIMLIKKVLYSDGCNLKLVKCTRAVFVALAVILLHSQMIQMSVDFDTMYRSKNSFQNIVMLILNKIESKNLLDSNKHYYIYGNFYDNELYYIQDYKDRYTKLDKVNYRFAVGNISNSEWWGYFLKHEFIREYMGINLFEKVPFEKYNSYFETDEFKKIKPFPADEGIFEISENDVIIKVSD